MQNCLFFHILIASVLIAFVSCDKDNTVIQKESISEAPWDYYFLNEGALGQNNASITAWKLKEGIIRSDIYFDQNGRNLGDVAKDLVFDKTNRTLFVSVSESRFIAKLDDHGKELARYETTIEDGKPRSLLLSNGSLYATMYGDSQGGWVARIDTATMSIKEKLRVGLYPEGLAEDNGTLAVCNSGLGSGDTVSFIELSSFTQTDEIALPYPYPRGIIECAGRFYCNTTEYDEKRNSVSRIVEIDPKTRNTRFIGKGFFMAKYDDLLYFVELEPLIVPGIPAEARVYNNSFYEYSPDNNNLQFLFSFSDTGNGVYGLGFNDDGEMIVLFNNYFKNKFGNSGFNVSYRNDFSRIQYAFNAGVLCSKVIYAH